MFLPIFDILILIIIIIPNNKRILHSYPVQAMCNLLNLLKIVWQENNKFIQV